MLSQWANTGGSGAGGLGATFVLGAQSTLVPTSSGGSSTPTFTRATTATVTDFEGRLVTVPSGAARFQGARFVYNAMAGMSPVNKSDDVTTLGQVDSGGSTPSSNQITFTASNGARALTQSGNYIPPNMTSVANTTWRWSADVWVDSGTKDVRLDIVENGVAHNYTAITATTTVQRFTMLKAFGAAAVGVQGGFQNDAVGVAGTIRVARMVLEQVTGQSNQNPSDYVSVGVLSAPFHGAGIDGVKYFTTQNGNTVASNVVTEATGAAISSANSKFGVLPGVSGSYFSTPDSVANSITGDIDIQVDLAPSSWTGTLGLAGKNNGTVSYYTYITGGIPHFRFTQDGTNQIDAAATSAVSFAAGTRGKLRFTRASSSGNVNIYTATGDTDAWALLGTPNIATTAGAMYAAGSELFEVGSINAGAAFLLSSKFYSAKIYNGIAGTLAVNFNANDFSSGTTWTASTTGETWTINGNAKVFGGSGTSSIPAPWDANGPQGYLSEGAGTQILATADIRDMTTVGWTLGATMTRARTSTGIDGVASTATRLTGGAVAATNIITTAIVAAATSRTYSAYVKRVTGTGIVRISQDNFATNTDITSQLINGSWVLIQLNQTQLNAVMGFKIDTSTDAIDVDCNQFESGAFATSRMLATGAARNADIDSYVTSGNIPASGAFVIAGAFTPNTADITLDKIFWSSYTDASNSIRIDQAASGSTLRFVRILAGSPTLASISLVPVAGTTAKYSVRYSPTSGLDIWVNGTKGTNSAVTTQPVFAATMQYGVMNSISQPYAALATQRIYGRDLSDAQCAALSV